MRIVRLVRPDRFDLLVREKNAAEIFHLIVKIMSVNP